jgi:hypothetical protein
VSQDPLGLAAGENVYGFGPNINTWVDPLGLSCDKSKDFITVYRGDQPGTKVIKSKAASQEGYRYSQKLIDKGNLDDLLKAHANDSSNPASPFISVTTDRRVAEHFAGPDGIVNEFRIPRNRIIQNIHNDMFVPAGSGGSLISESEWLVPNYIRPSEFVR